MVQEERLFKRFLIRSSGGPCVQWGGTVYAIHFRVHYGEPSCEVILNLNQWLRRRCHLNIKFRDGRMTDKDRSQ